MGNGNGKGFAQIGDAVGKLEAPPSQAKAEWRDEATFKIGALEAKITSREGRSSRLYCYWIGRRTNPDTISRFLRPSDLDHDARIRAAIAAWFLKNGIQIPSPSDEPLVQD